MTTVQYTAAEAVEASVALHQSLRIADRPKILTITYTASVYTKAGWRSVTIKAEAEQISAGMAKVTRVLEIDGETPRGTMSRTGASRQQYWGTGVAQREIGGRKRLSACEVEA